MAVDNVVNDLNAANLYALEWLKRLILCYVYFIAIRGRGGPRESRCFSAALCDSEGWSAGEAPADAQ